MAKSSKPQVKYAHPNLAHFFRLPGAQPGPHPQQRRSAGEGTSSSSSRGGGTGSSGTRRNASTVPRVPPAPPAAVMDTQRSSRRVSASSSVHPPSDAGAEQPQQLPRCGYCGRPKQTVSSTGTQLCRECEEIVVIEE